MAIIRRNIDWKLKSRTLRLGQRTFIVAPIALSPSSDGTKNQDPERILARALQLDAQGADVIDLGAEPTRAEDTPLPAEEELKRLLPVLKRLKNKLNVPICVSTYKAAVADEVLKMGAEIINDPSGLTWEPILAKTIMNHDAGLILNHMRGRPNTWGKLPPAKDVIGVIAKDMDAAVHRALRAGIEKFRLVIDPGLSFGKRKEQNYEILGRLSVLGGIGVPVMVGPTKKLLVEKANERELEFAGAAGVTAAILSGAYIVRVHDLEAIKPVIAVADGILNQWR
ncbi:dihydropteroate synthase [Bryobacter aggregatus]|uniref:dihydropteroate synthase n=1 Tax=Bryobacter aggregatus TaxID=360054 RepID=UPI0005666C38|nr:dihydropteroate synthase [Bryobacter aggregatus]